MFALYGMGYALCCLDVVGECVIDTFVGNSFVNVWEVGLGYC